MPFREDFPTVLTNLTALADLSAKFTNKKGLFVERHPDRKIKFRHILFEKLPEAKSDSSTSETASESDAEFPPRIPHRKLALRT
ncbi:hypothetical protein K443DRAFT_681462 [Laccaria amethystina LaAM-08-1]|uniref:Uncharacterized protein n=1 Tax=Laccaria amethystina LaAM-08-1 TaxID=1095629 RepID=A0A0C9XNF2_9AGAR|nr:hypothetical protein K443DRAFT_681462 [Laccaria amethystina LaAM-08-1]